MGATLFTALAEGLVGRYAAMGQALNVDPMRIVEAIATGVSFLGAGMIFVDRDRVRGLTTAASIWVTAAIGVTIGLERYVLAVAATILALVTLHLLPSLGVDKQADGTESGER